MSPVTHFLVGWVAANGSKQLNRRERAAITLAGVLPDLDGLGIIVEWLTRDTARPLMWYSQFHHQLCHNIGFGLLITAIAFVVSRRRWLTAGLVFLSFHLHLLCDLAGSRSPDGHQWPIPYLLPFSDAWQLTWAGQWELTAWPNFVITGAMLLLVLALARNRGYSPVEMVSTSADCAFVEQLRRRFPVGA